MRSHHPRGRPTAVLTTTLTVVALLASGCLDPVTAPVDPGLATAGLVPAEPLWVMDAAGDEQGFAVDMLSYGPSCRIGCEVLPAPISTAAAPAPLLDILRVGLSAEDADAFSLVIEVASLEESFAAMDQPDATHRVAEYYACWEPVADGATRCAILLASPTKEGPVVLSTFNILGAEKCSATWKECAWDVAATLTYGSPGTIRFDVPKAFASWDGAPSSIHNLRASTGWFSSNKVIPLWHLAWTVRVPGDHNHDHEGLSEPAGVADVTSAASDHRVLTPVADGSLPARPGPVMQPGRGNLLGAGGIRDHPELDLVELDMHEEGTDLVVSFRMAGLDAMPTYDLQLALLMELSDGHDWELGVMQANGDAYGYVGRCVSFGCHHAFLNRTSLDLADDAYTIRFPVAALGNPAQGVHTNWLMAYTMYGEFNHDVGPAGQDGSLNLHSGSLIDMHVGGQPFTFAGQGAPTNVPHQH